MEKVLELPLNRDIEPLYRYLQSQRVGIQISEEAGKQVVWVIDPTQKPLVLEAAKRYIQDADVQGKVESWYRDRRTVTEPFWNQFAGYPVICLLLLSLLLTALWTGFGSFDSHRYFLFLDRREFPFPQLANPLDGLVFIIQQGEFWRLFAPAWLHWSVLHWLFNSLALWIFGRSLEIYMGRAGFLILVFTSALVSNVSQFMMSGPGFGGFSGVAYALIGAHAAGMLMAPGKGIWVYPSLVVVSVLWMAMGMFGFSDWFGMHLANTAHFMGFLTGVIGMGLMLKLSD